MKIIAFLRNATGISDVISTQILFLNGIKCFITMYMWIENDYCRRIPEECHMCSKIISKNTFRRNAILK